MKSIVPILALGIVFTASAALARPGSNIFLAPPAVVTPPAPPTVNSDVLSTLPQQTIGITTMTNPIGTPQLSGALPGEPGSPTYNPNAALPSPGNAGSSLSPSPGTSAAGFNAPSVGSGTSPFSGTGG